MTTADIPAAEPLTAAKDSPLKDAAAEASFWMRLESLLDRLGDRLNPILVKEARQAMKSRQFVVTFTLLLVFGWLWTVLFISFGVPAIFYAPVGPVVLLGYYVVLSIPLLIVVPYAAFRSLAAEREDGTYELLSITTLSARQIVVGKLGSAMLQMVVYYSALAPCIAFTYLLRGIDVVTIGLVLSYTFLASLLLSVFGLMMATITRARHWQVLLSVVFVMALLVFTLIWDYVLLAVTLMTAMPIDQLDFWVSHLCALSFYVPAIVLLVFIAGGQITFASENRSTPIRAVLAVVPLVGLGWVTYYWMRFNEGNVLFALSIFAGLYWALAGAFLSGETAQLSPRAKRSLPQSFLGRMLFTWFNPGSGTGYVFALLNLVAVFLTAALAVSLSFLLGYERVPQLPEWLYFSGGVLAYVAAYLGFVRLAVVAMRQLTPVSMMAAFLCQAPAAFARGSTWRSKASTWRSRRSARRSTSITRSSTTSTSSRRSAKGAVFVDDLDDVPEGATLLFSAHGVSPEIRRVARERKLRAIDATCPLVTKVHLEAIRFAREGYTIVLIGHEGTTR
jgi:hypothetical protein